MLPRGLGSDPGEGGGGGRGIWGPGLPSLTAPQPPTPQTHPQQKHFPPPPLPRCSLSLPCPLHSPLSVRHPRPVWLCCPSPFLLALADGARALLLLPRPHTDFASPHDVDCPACGGLVTALLPPPRRAPPLHAGCSPRLCGVRRHLAEGGRGPGCQWRVRRAPRWVVAAVLCSAWSPCVLQCALLGLVPPPCAGRPSPFGWCTRCRWCALWEGRSVASFVPWWPLGCPTVAWVMPGATPPPEWY